MNHSNPEVDFWLDVRASSRPCTGSRPTRRVRELTDIASDSPERRTRRGLSLRAARDREGHRWRSLSPGPSPIVVWQERVDWPILYEVPHPGRTAA